MALCFSMALLLPSLEYFEKKIIVSTHREADFAR